MIDKFDRKRFEAVLEQVGDFRLAQSRGEMVYTMDGSLYTLYVGSSMGPDGVAQESGENSIRVYASVERKDGSLIWIKGDNDYVTRVPGWEGRLTSLLKEQIGRLNRIKRTPPKSRQGLFFVKKEGRNQGRPFTKTDDGAFVWLDEEPEEMPVQNDKIQPESGLFEALRAAPVKTAQAAIQLTDEQQAVVDAPMNVPLRVPATAGSGKTKTIEHRIARLLKDGVPPEQIVVVTFSRTQADDMLKRILATNPQLDGTPIVEAITTTHAFCYRMMKRYGGETRSIPKNWEMKKILNEILRRYWPVPEERPAWDELYSVIHSAKMLLTVGDYGWHLGLFGEHAGSLIQAQKDFDRAMRVSGWLTFTDMLYDFYNLMIEGDDFCRRVQAQFKYVIVDEAQDTNTLSMKIMQLVAAPENHIMMVGDNDQMMYRFAGASDETMYEGFDGLYPENVTLPITVNFRSKWNIVDLAQKLIGANYWQRGGAYDDRYAKACRHWREGDARVEFTEYDDAETEAFHVTDAIDRMIKGGVKPGQFFVCARTRAQLGIMEGPMLRAKLPFVNLAGNSFFAQKHIKDVLMYVRLAWHVGDGENDADALKRVCNIASRHFRDRYGEYSPTRWLGAQFLAACDSDWNRLQYAVQRDRRWGGGVMDLMDTVAKIQDGLKDGLARAVTEVMEVCYREYLRVEEGLAAEDADEGKLNDIDTLIEIVARFNSPAELFDFVERAETAQQAAKDKQLDDYVVLSTVHRLKGLERDVVFVIGVSEGLKVDKRGVETPVGLMPHTAALSPMPGTQVLGLGGGMTRMEDERCIFFVACTRAKNELYLSSIREYRNAEMWPSRFLKEAGIIQEVGHDIDRAGDGMGESGDLPDPA